MFARVCGAEWECLGGAVIFRLAGSEQLTWNISTERLRATNTSLPEWKTVSSVAVCLFAVYVVSNLKVISAHNCM